jgi:large subunit ribosomal protein L1
MKKHGKKYTNAKERIDAAHIFSFKQGLEKVKEVAFAKFDESVDAHVNLGIDATKGEQVVRGAVLLPHSLGKEPVVIVFAKGDYADKAKKAGADHIGAEDLIEKIEGGWTAFDYAIATPDLMGAVGKLAKILGPKGLLPNKKVGTVTFDVASIVNDLKKGRKFFKNDKSAIVHFTFGKVSFDKEKLYDNFITFLKALAAVKPPSAKGKFLKSITVTSTMGLGIPVNPDEIYKS